MLSARSLLFALCLASAPGCVPALVVATGAGLLASHVDGEALVVNAPAHGALTPMSHTVAIPGRAYALHHADLWTITAPAYTPVTVLMCESFGSDLDPYLTVRTPYGPAMSDDDSAGGYHGHGSRLVLPPTGSPESYTVYASSFRSAGNGDSGRYTLQVLAGAQPWARCAGAMR